MPLIINQMPSGALQYPIVTGPSSAQINSANMFGFINQQPNKEADMAAMLALVQLLGQQKNIDLQREMGRDDNSLRREELKALLSEKGADREMQRVQNDRMYSMTAEQMGLTRTELNARIANLEKQANTAQLLAQAEADRSKAATDAVKQQTGAYDTMMQKGESAEAQGRVSGILENTLSQQRELSGLDVASKQTAQVGAFNAGANQVERYIPASVRSAMATLNSGGQLSPSEAGELTKGLETFTTVVKDKARTAASDDERAGMVTAAGEIVDQIRSSMTPDKVATWFGRKAPKKDAFERVDYAAQANLERLSSVPGATRYPSRSAYENQMKLQAIEQQKRDAAQRYALQGQAQSGVNQILAQTPLTGRPQAFNQLANQLFAPSQIEQILSGGQGGGAPASAPEGPQIIRVPASAPSVEEWDPFLQGLGR